MYIKRVVIHGFKSYRDEVVYDDLSPHHNVVLGRNGSGKSSFYEAVRFVLSDHYTNMPREMRQRLLYIGSGRSAVHAYVEIVFDNTSSRLPVDGDEVTIRRSIGAKKDEYFLNRKHIKREDVMAVLETAGLSRSNPYYIVQQGRVLSLWRMTDEERLALLKDVAGTRVYESRRDQSTRELEGTQAQRRQIDDVIKYIDTRLGELEGEKEELQQYKQLDRRQRALQYTVCQRDIDEAAEELEREGQRVEALADPIEERRGELQRVSSELEGQRERRRVLRGEVDAARAEAEGSEAEASRLATRVARLNVDAEAAQSAVERAAEDAKERDAKLAELRRAAGAAERELDALRPQREARAAAHATALGEVQRLQRAVEALEEKAGRSKQFRSRKERDAWLDSEIARLQDQQRSKGGEVEAQEARREAAADGARAKRALAARSAAKEEEATAKQGELTGELEALRRRRHEFVKQRESQRAEADLRRELDQARSELADAEQALRHTMRATQWRGLAGLEQAVRALGLEGRVFGPLADLVQLSTPAAATAVEVIGGNSLFNVVVDDEATATRLLQHMRTHKVGRLTFSPLAQLRAEERALPQDAGDDAVLLSAQLGHDDAVHRAVVQVFGKALLCRDAATASRLATADSKFTCVTTDGTKVSASGEVSGGYHDRSALRLVAWQRHKEARRKVDRATRSLREAEESAAQHRQEATQVVQRIQQCEAELMQLRSVRSAACGERVRAEADVTRLEKDAAEAEARTAALKGTLEDLRERERQRADERASPMASSLSSAEEAELARLRSSLPDAEKLLREAQAELDAVSSKTTKLATLLEVDYSSRIAALEAGPGDDDDDAGGGGGDEGDGDVGAGDEGDGGTGSGARRGGAPRRGAAAARSASAGGRRASRGGASGKRSRSKGRSSRGGADEEEPVAAAGAEEDGFGEVERVQSLDAAQQRLAAIRAALEEAEAELEVATRVAAAARTRATRKEEELQELVDEADELEAKRNKLDREVTSLAAKMDKALARRGMLRQRKARHMAAVRNLGSLPADELDGLRGLAKEALTGELGKVADELKRFSKVNKKAYDQYVNFAEQRESLVKQKKDVERSEVSIRELMEVLDMRKDEAIFTTFQRVSRHFREVFAELVPNGQAQLVMKTAETDEEDDLAETQEIGVEGAAAADTPAATRTQLERVSTYRGVGIKVSFTAGQPTQDMNLFSGGQKSLVALSLIFAIQRSDPAPFYLFDEIDSALDHTHRAAVAALIRRQCARGRRAGAGAAAGGEEGDSGSEDNEDEEDEDEEDEDEEDEEEDGGASRAKRRRGRGGRAQRGAGKRQRGKKASRPKSSEPVQFVTSTFGRELVEVADMCFAVRHIDKVSTVEEQTKEEAIAFIEGIQQEEQDRRAGAQ